MSVFIACDGNVLIDAEGRPMCKTLDGVSNANWMTYSQTDLQASISPQLSKEEADGLLAATILLWAVAFIFRMARKSILNERG